MKTGNGAAGDGNEDEGEQLAAEYGAATIGKLG